MRKVPKMPQGPENHQFPDVTHRKTEKPVNITRFTVRLERVLLGLVLCLGLALAYVRWTEQDRVSQMDRALEWVVEAQRGQIVALKATRDSLVANDLRLLEMMRFHGRWHAEQDEKNQFLNPEGD